MLEGNSIVHLRCATPHALSQRDPSRSNGAEGCWKIGEHYFVGVEEVPVASQSLISLELC